MSSLCAARKPAMRRCRNGRNGCPSQSRQEHLSIARRGYALLKCVVNCDSVIAHIYIVQSQITELAYRTAKIHQSSFFKRITMNTDYRYQLESKSLTGHQPRHRLQCLKAPGGIPVQLRPLRPAIK